MREFQLMAGCGIICVERVVIAFLAREQKRDGANQMRRLALMTMMVLSATSAIAHDWYSHRTVPGSAGHLPCCGGKDCFRVTEGEFNEWMLHKNSSMQPAQDGEDNNFHICTREIWNMYRNHWDY